MKTTLKRGVARARTNGAAPFPRPPLTTVTRYRRPRRGILASVGRILAWIVVVALVAAGGLAGGVWLWWERSVAATAPASAEEKAAQEALEKVPPPDQPAVALVIGYDSRQGPDKGNPPRSDTVLLVRADPGVEAISMLSLPRDLRVELAPCKGHPPRVGRINEAFTDCGTRGTLETVRRLTGIPVNYFVTVNFRGFIQIVNDLGGVYIDVDRRYFNDRSGPGGYAKIDLHAGYQRLNGADALSFVRYRHSDSDLYRNARQQEFLKAVKQQVSGLSAAWKLRGIVNAITSNVTVGVGGGGKLAPETVLSYAKLAYELPSGSFLQTRIEDLSDNGSYELVAPESSIREAVDAFLRPDPDAARKAASAAVGEKPRPRAEAGPPPSSVTLEVLNGNGVAGAADEAAYLLGQRGYRAVNGGNADRADYFKTLIFYDTRARGAKLAAEGVAKLFADVEVKPAPADAGLQAMVRVVVGRTFQGTLSPAPRDETPKHVAPSVVEDASAVGLLKRAQRRVGFPVLAPTVRERGSQLSTLEAMRVYDLHGEKAVRLVYNGPSGTDYWGIQQAGWTGAPALEGASVTRRLGGREYRLFFNGARLHVVAFEENGAAYWVVNTLLDALSNETMLAIAQGLKPVR